MGGTPFKIFGLGLNKTGTSSLGRSLVELGFGPLADSAGDGEPRAATRAALAGDYSLAVAFAGVLLANGLDAQKKKNKQSWVKGVPYTTDWKKAIKQARESGKMLFIYNGWKNPNI